MSHPKCPFNIKLLRRRLSEEKRRHCGGAARHDRPEPLNSSCRQSNFPLAGGGTIDLENVVMSHVENDQLTAQQAKLLLRSYHNS